MRIGIVGTRGIPNNYGGFEQFAEYLSKHLVSRGHSVAVYNSHNHPYSANTWQGVDILHKYDPEQTLGTIGQFVYDFNCILDSRKRNFDIILQLGYTSNSIWGELFSKSAVIVTNMDGLEWKRSKYSKVVQSFLKFAERLATKNSDSLISDSVGVQEYLKGKYGIESKFIPYGANTFTQPDEAVLKGFDITPGNYSLLIARLEPENNIQTILEGVAQSTRQETFLVIGNYQTPYGRYLKRKFSSEKYIRFAGTIYDIDKLNNLRYFSKLYFHGHTVGGTNPSLLEAMASKALVCAHDNIFNNSILGQDAYYFSDSNQITRIINEVSKDQPDNLAMVERNLTKISSSYSWKEISAQYEAFFYKQLNLKGKMNRQEEKDDKMLREADPV